MRTEGCTAKMVFSHSTFYQRLSDRVVHSKLFRIFTLKMRLIAHIGSRGRFPRVFGDKFGDEFSDKFGDEFSESPNLVMN